MSEIPILLNVFLLTASVTMLLLGIFLCLMIGREL